MSRAVNGHGTVVAIELDPLNMPGVFTNVGEVSSDVTYPPLSRDKTDVTPQEDNISTSIFGYLMAGEAKFDINFIFSLNTHNSTTGLLSHISKIQNRGMRIRGPQGTSGMNEWIFSGQVSNVSRVGMNKGQDKAAITFQPSGPFIMEGAIFAG